ncbi:hypothetical protein Ddc_09263 [Ditylenchus destructor]|nr:hypothetical protein Ddc_09263 [Ditylenchus destructor]
MGGLMKEMQGSLETTKVRNGMNGVGKAGWIWKCGWRWLMGFDVIWIGECGGRGERGGSILSWVCVSKRVGIGDWGQGANLETDHWLRSLVQEQSAWILDEPGK